jgi:hypothetical protein
MLDFKARNVRFVCERHADLVEPVQQPVTAEGIDRKRL